MSGSILKLPFGRVLNPSGAAGPRRLVVIVALALTAGGAIAWVTLRGNQTASLPALAKSPDVNPLPGGPHTSPAYSDLALRHDQEKSAKLAAAGLSSVATMPGSATATPQPPLPVATMPADPPPTAARVVPAEPGWTASPPARPIAVSSGAPAYPPHVTQQQGDDNQTKAYQAAIGALMSGWGNKPQVTEVLLKPDDEQRGSPSTAGSGREANATLNGQSDAAQGPVPNARPLQGASRVLMPAGRGIYGRTILAASSDQGGPVAVEALSGPIAGDRMTGGFERREDRLVIRLDNITLKDGTQQKVDALVIAPDTMETSVASSVDQHYAARFILPVAAAFVSGLGQAIAQSNSTVVAGPLGGATAFQNLNLGQEFGVAAGAGAAQFGQAIKDAAPKGPTVKVDANVNVGVFFLAPLVVGGDR